MLSRNHLAKNCSSNVSCHLRSGRHHQAICAVAKPKDSPNAGPTSGALPEKPKVDPSPGTLPLGNSPALTDYVDSNSSVLLQTAVGLVKGFNHSDPEISIRIIFDSGSQRSYISKSSRKKLGLPALKYGKLLIKTFGQENEQLRTSEVVELFVRGLDRNHEVPVTAYTIPLICTFLQDQGIEVAQQMYVNGTEIQSVYKCCIQP